MKKFARTLLALALALLLAVSCMGAAYAATAETVIRYGEAGGYLAIGDSISRGCGSDGFYLEQDKAEGGQYDLYYLRNVKGAVPTQIAAAVGCTMPDLMTEQDATFWPCCYPGMTVAVMLDLLGVDDGFQDEKLNYAYYSDMLQYFGYEGSLEGVRPGDVYNPDEDGQCGNIIDLISKADLITLQLGMCDVFYRAYRVVSNGGMLKDGMNFDLSSADAIKALVSTAISEMNFGYQYFEKHYTMLLDKIKELNPDATVVIVGAFNVVNQLTITDDLLCPLGTAFSTITDGMNMHYRQWAKDYGVLYADIANTETLAAENDWSLLGEFKDNTFTGTHPSQKGYDYIVRQIIDVLPPDTACRDIRVDLGRFTNVDYVFVNGIPVNNYSMDGYVLTIPYAAPGATNLVIGVKNGDGTVAVQNYTLIWRAGQGYDAYRVWGNNDLETTAKKPWTNLVRLLKTVFQKIADAIKRLFSKT